VSISAQLSPIIRADAARKFPTAVRGMKLLLDGKVPVDTGLLFQSQSISVSLGLVLSATFVYPLDYAEYQDKPAKTITAKRGRYLRFQIDGKWVMTRSVNVSQANKGWFSDTTRLGWTGVLQAAFG
jgi:hypothetical protein